MKIIAISGKKGAGKSTVSQMIESICNSNDFPVVQMGFADALKDEICETFKVTRTDIEVKKDRFRPILQSWGELRRFINGEDYWTNQLLNKISKLPNTTKLVLIYDLRYKNEATILRKYNGSILIRINRFIPFLALDKHSSETDLDDYDQWDEVIDNTRSKSLNDILTEVSQILIKRKVVLS